MALINPQAKKTVPEMTTKPAKKRNILQSLKRDYQLWIMILPAIVIIIIFNYIPMYGVQLAFREYDFTKGITGGEWVGLHYFKEFINSYMFADLMKNTVVISLATIILGFPAPIILALIINQVIWKRWKKAIQTTVYLQKDLDYVNQLNITGTPTIYVNGVKFEGSSYNELLDMVNEAAEK